MTMHLSILLFCLFLIIRATVPVCDTPCLAFQWSYPLWHMTNLRYLQDVNSRVFEINNFEYRVADITQKEIVLCDARICNGEPSESPLPPILPGFGVNPAPVVAPNVDTIYGAAQLDLNGDACFQLTIPVPKNVRYYSVSFVDFYTNIPKSFNSVTYPEGGSFCLSQSNFVCKGTIANISLPRFTQFIVRIYSDGSFSEIGSCGAQGCHMMKAIDLSVIVPPKDVIDPKEVYFQYMGPDACPYVYNDTSFCGGKNLSSYWDAVCQAIFENPLSGEEAAYVDYMFSSLGITSAGCTDLDYDVLNTALTTEPNSGYTITSTEAQLYQPVTPGSNWLFFPFDGEWGNDYYTRALASWRLHLLNSDTYSVYYTAFTSTSLEPLTSNKCYQLNWLSNDSFVDDDMGFWSVTLYDNTYFLVENPRGSRLPPTDIRRYAVRGTGSPKSRILMKTSCTNEDEEYCILLPQNIEPFNIILRGYIAKNNFFPGGGYPLPEIWDIEC